MAVSDVVAAGACDPSAPEDPPGVSGDLGADRRARRSMLGIELVQQAEQLESCEPLAIRVVTVHGYSAHIVMSVAAAIASW